MQRTKVFRAVPINDYFQPARAVATADHGLKNHVPFTWVNWLPMASASDKKSRSVVAHSRWLSSRAVENSVAIGLADALALLLALAAGGLLRYALVEQHIALPPGALLLIPGWWIGALVTGLLPGWGLSAVDHLRRQVLLITTLFCFGAVLLFFTRMSDQTSRLGIGVAWLLALVLLPVGRTITRHLLCARKAYGMPTIIYGRAQVAAEVAERLRADPGLGYIPVGICSDETPGDFTDLPSVGDFQQIQPRAPAAIIASSGMDALTNHRVIEQVLSVYRTVTILPDLGDVPSSFVQPRDLTGTVGLEISQSLFSPYATKVKRAMDLSLVLLTAVLWFPVVAGVCALIWIGDRKNPLFLQKRMGRGGQAFFVIKCRTMVPDAEGVLERYLSTRPALQEQWEKEFKLEKDPRITWVGSFLRRTSLDELPQLFNVLRGDMALVGPRPLPPYHLDRLPASVRKMRAGLRPGLTGLWQVSGRSDVGTEGMKRWDHYYVRNWSLWLDFVILIRTGRAVLLGSGAR